MRSEKIPSRVTVVEVGLRDGLQIVPGFLPTERKLQLVDALIAAGLHEIEVTSFVHPKAVPQLADAEALVAALPQNLDVHYWALVPNEKGAERAAECKLYGVSFVLSASESHNQANVRMSVAESLARLPRMIEIARSAKLKIRAGLATAFGCPFEGDVPVSRVVEVVSKIAALGINHLSLADTTGMADPRQVSDLLQKLQSAFPKLTFSVHFHNTRGAGMANVIAALEEGISTFDSSVGGVGGCPFAPGATGNVCTEDMVHMFQRMGIETGIDVNRLLDAARLSQRLLGFELPGQVMKAGPAWQLHVRTNTVQDR